MQAIDYDVFGLNSVWHGVIIALDNILGLILLPLFGKLSDSSSSRFGKRKPFIVFGTILSMLGFAGVCIFASLGKDFFIPFLICLIVCLGSLAAYRSPGLALVPDVNPDRDRSKANAVSNIVSVIFTVLAMLYFFFFMRFEGFYAIGLSIIITTLALLVFFCATVKEPKFRSDMMLESERAAAREREEERLRRENNELKIKDTTENLSENYAYSKSHSLDILSFKEDSMLHLPSFESALRHESLSERRNKKGDPDTDDNSGYTKEQKRRERKLLSTNKFLILAVVFCFYMAYNALTSNFIKYAEIILGFKQNDAIVPMILAQLAAILCFPASSMLAGKIGRRNTIFIGFLIMVGAFGFTAYFTTPNPALYVCFAVLGISFGLVMVNIYPFFLELSPSDKIGVNTGYFSVSMTVAMVITPILSGFLISATGGWFGGAPNAGFRVLFPYSIVFLVLAIILTLFIRGSKPAGDIKRGLESFDVD